MHTAAARNVSRLLRPAGRRRVLAALFVLSAVVLSTCGVTQAAEHAAMRAAMDSITEDELKQHVDTLADDVFEGREAGSRGGHAAATYLRKQLEKLGIEAAGPDGAWFQSFAGNYRNLIAVIRGSDPNLSDEYILVSAHYDHVGYGSRSTSYGPLGYIHNGADDNASGVAALLELIRALLRLPQSPSRSILIVFWDGEEQGLLGSRHWIANPTVPLDKVKLLINLDMIGRLREGKLEVSGTRTARGLRRLVSTINPSDSLWFEFRWDVRANSDHWPFFQQGIPHVQYHTGMHDDYHRPSDDVHLINSEGMREIVQLLFATVVKVADAPELSKFRAASRQESEYRRRRFERPLPALPPRLGITWDPDRDDAGKGVFVTGVDFASPAAAAKLQSGDRVVAVDGQPIDNADQLRAAVLLASGETTITVERVDSESPVELKADLPERPIRIGISWREDESEPGVVMITRVIAGSPAAAELRPRDRIYQVNGQDFVGSDELLDMLTSADDTLSLQIERRGRIETVELQLPTLPSSQDAVKP